MPYRIDISDPSPDALERLVDLGALDVAETNRGLAAILPDGVAPEAVAGALGVSEVTVSAAVGCDDGSVWLLSPRMIRIEGVAIAPAGIASPPDALQLTESSAFGTGYHPTTALCIEAIQDAVANYRPESILDIGTGSGVLALVALVMGVSTAVGIDIDPDAVKVAEDNARLNNLSGRLRVVLGGPEAVSGSWPLVVANVVAAPLIDMAPFIVRRVGHRGRLILSGISSSLAGEVSHAYEQLGMHHVRSEARMGWTVLVFAASW